FRGVFAQTVVDDRVGPGDVGTGPVSGRQRLGHVDLHAHERTTQRFAEAVGAQRSRAAAAQCAVHHEVQGAHVGRFIAIDATLHHRSEVLLHALGRDRAPNDFERFVVVGEDRDVGDVALVAGAVTTEFTQLHHVTSWITTRT